MAVPNSFDIEKLSGVWVLDHRLSDKLDPILAIQGVSWIQRKALSLVSVTLTITTTSSTSPKAPTKLLMINTANIPLSPPPDERTLDWKGYPKNGPLFGSSVMKSRYVDLKDLEVMTEIGDKKHVDRYLTAGGGEKGLQSWNVAEGQSWTVEEVWSFEPIDKQNCLTRRVVASKPNGGEQAMARMVYTFVRGN